MKTKYNINKNELVVNLDFLYDTYDNQNEVQSIRKYINKLILDNNINEDIKRIIVYKDGLLIGTFYLTNYYLRKLNYLGKDNFLTSDNSYFYENKYIELNHKNNIKTKKVLEIY